MEQRGDFLGFSFAGVHSSELNIVRTSDGDRFDEDLNPEIKDITVEVPGMDGEYFFGSTYGTRTFEINIAFNSLTEEQFRRLRQIYGRKQIGELIFDERPYKKYLVKIESPIKLSFICFDEPKKTIGPARDGVRVASRKTEEIINPETGEIETITTVTREQVTPYIVDTTRTERIYKGDGTISFIAYYPFAKSVYKQLPFNYVLTSDEDIVENKKYFIYNNLTQLYDLVINPVQSEINTYYERVNREEVNSWAVSSGILSVNDYENFDTYNSETGIINIYNAGDVSTGFRLYFPATAAGQEITLTYKPIALNNQLMSILAINPITLLTEDEGFIIDTNNGLIVGVSNFNIALDGNVTYKTTGNIYNRYVKSGFFFKLEPNEKNDGATLQIDGGVEGIKIFYDYLYF